MFIFLIDYITFIMFVLLGVSIGKETPRPKLGMFLGAILGVIIGGALVNWGMKERHTECDGQSCIMSIL